VDDLVLIDHDRAVRVAATPLIDDYVADAWSGDSPSAEIIFDPLEEFLLTLM